MWQQHFAAGCPATGLRLRPGQVEFQKAGVRGISLLFASGDGGAACDTHNKYHPNWPASSPYVTAVGGTTSSNPEVAVGLSSGGFSNRYTTPPWQTAAVARYLAGPNVPNRSFFNASGRGFPDIAAQAEGFTVVANFVPMPGVAGTSCASPTAAGVIGLLNDLRLQAGKPTLGFLNPFLYQLAHGGLTDITKGASASGCGSFDQPGYPAVVGWCAFAVPCLTILHTSSAQYCPPGRPGLTYRVYNTFAGILSPVWAHPTTPSSPRRLQHCPDSRRDQLEPHTLDSRETEPSLGCTPPHPRLDQSLGDW